LGGNAEPQRVRDDEDARKGHGGGGNDRVDNARHGERESGHVIGERPEKVALYGRQRAERQADGVGGSTQVPAHEGEV
jgi:hypothetical protein